ncbi:MAG TPA: hypothetical protein VHE60_16895 [Pyrinomonadaceae bacterium]|nr:hypothetical protein [Pyrinomonadaceae bacterium]
MNTKSPKELAFLQDPYVATDWGERFAGAVPYLIRQRERESYAFRARVGHLNWIRGYKYVAPNGADELQPS